VPQSSKADVSEEKKNLSLSPANFSSLTDAGVFSWTQLTQNPKESLEKAQAAFLTAQEKSDDEGKRVAWFNLGWGHFYLSQQAEALNCFTNLLESALASQAQFWEENARIGLGASYQQLSRFDLAMEQLTVALNLARQRHDSVGQIDAGRRLGEVQLALDKPLDALEYFLNAQKIAEKHSERGLLTDILLSLGQSYLALHRNDQALEFLSRALVLTKEITHRSGEARALTLIGLIYRDIGEMDISEEYHLESLKICQAIEHPWGQLEASYNLGELNLIRGRLEVAERYFEKVITLSALLDSRAHTAKAYARLSECWEKAGYYQKALGYERQANALERDLRADEIAQKTRNLMIQTEFEKSRAQAEILRLRSEGLERQKNELKITIESLKVLADWGQRIAGALTAEDLFGRIHDSLSNLLDFDAYGLALFQPKTRFLHFPYVLKDGQRMMESFPPIAIERLDRLVEESSVSAILIPDLYQIDSPWLDGEKIAPLVGYLGVKSGILLPLVEPGRLLGVLYVGHSQVKHYTETNAQALSALGGFIAVALRNTLNHRKVSRLNLALRREARELEKANLRIRHMAQHDILTGLANRWLLGEFLARTIAFCQRTKKTFSVFFLDLDGFKPVNDQFGHDAGDWVLNQLGKRLKDLLRDSDLVARVGGDEFVALALEVESVPQATVIAQKLLSVIRRPLNWNSTELRLDASIGISMFPQDGKDAEELVNHADDAMYRVKKSGKSGWGFYSVPTSDVTTPSE
jgi:diguanylate cyclase (GGDEF)-like protein